MRAALRDARGPACACVGAGAGPARGACAAGRGSPAKGLSPHAPLPPLSGILCPAVQVSCDPAVNCLGPCVACNRETDTCDPAVYLGDCSLPDNSTGSCSAGQCQVGGAGGRLGGLWWGCCCISEADVGRWQKSGALVARISPLHRASLCSFFAPPGPLPPSFAAGCAQGSVLGTGPSAPGFPAKAPASCPQLLAPCSRCARRWGSVRLTAAAPSAPTSARRAGARCAGVKRDGLDGASCA